MDRKVVVLVSIDTIQAAPLLASLPAPARAALDGYAREVRFERNERLVSLMRPPERLLVIGEGLAKLVGVSANGHERILFVYRPGDLVSADIVLDKPAGEYETTAMSRVEAIAIPRRHVLRVAREHPELLLALTREVARQLDGMTARVVSATSSEVPVRLSGLLLEFADGRSAPDGFVPLTHALTHESMSQIVGASRPHTSTVLRDLEQIGAVQRRSPRGLLVRPDRLRAIVELGEVDGFEPPGEIELSTPVLAAS